MTIMTSADNPLLRDFRRLLDGIIGGWHPDQVKREAAWWLELIGLAEGDAAKLRRYGFDYPDMTRAAWRHGVAVLKRLSS